ncbi:hypothetical protein N7456_004641 [Penicillium angulare]|uniref:Uncharacterized protein n=1 Tax=Penicillium angulare TaxID=116970 RepID=A0A9W9FWT6_9EURO|nr:hypothetical protein N7456_004641 [Penicillium angulare]
MESFHAFYLSKAPSAYAVGIVIIFGVCIYLTGSRPGMATCLNGWLSLERSKGRWDLGQLPLLETQPDFDWKTEKPKELRPFKSIYNMSMGTVNIP